MKVTGIICEYNPLHLGHKKQLDIIRASHDAENGIVCLMSGNYVQRGMPAILDKELRAKAAIGCGADLVLELPITAALSSAEGFAAEGVRLLSGFCTDLCFGAEDADEQTLVQTAQALLSDDFSYYLHSFLEQGISFPAARQQALEAMGLSGAVVTQPNNILAVEYCKAILAQGSSMAVFPIRREGSYHDILPQSENPSATALRRLMMEEEAWENYVPKNAASIFRGAVQHDLSFGQRAVLARLRTMEEADFAALPYGSEGLWRKLMHACRKENTLEDIATAVKSKRYTRTRIDRMILCAFLGITAETLSAPAPYARVLAFNDKGRAILKKARQTGLFPNIGETTDHPYQLLENRADDLFGLFSRDTTEPPQIAEKRRVYYHKSE